MLTPRIQVTEYCQNGIVASTGLYEDDLENGHWIDYHENGLIASEGDYVNGEGAGKWFPRIFL